MLSLKGALVLPLLLPLCELLRHHTREELLRLDQRHLYVAVRVSLSGDLESYRIR